MFVCLVGWLVGCCFNSVCLPVCVCVCGGGGGSCNNIYLFVCVFACFFVVVLGRGWILHAVHEVISSQRLKPPETEKSQVFVDEKGNGENPRNTVPRPGTLRQRYTAAVPSPPALPFPWKDMVKTALSSACGRSGDNGLCLPLEHTAAVSV